MKSNQTLVDALLKFQEWAEQLAEIESDEYSDAADNLMLALYGNTSQVQKLIGGSNAPILADAAARIRQQAKSLEMLSSKEGELMDALYLNPRNLGGHRYPGIGPFDEMHTSDCAYCKCWMGASRSGGPEGIDPFGDCPGNPKLRDAYRMLKSRSQETPS